MGNSKSIDESPRRHQLAEVLAAEISEKIFYSLLWNAEELRIGVKDG